MGYGPSRLLEEFRREGYGSAVLQQANDGQMFLLLEEFSVPVGRFAGRVIALALPATPDFPRSVGAAIHVRAMPHLLQFENVPNIRNIQASVLGEGWQYWSHQIPGWSQERERPGRRLMQHVCTIFDRA